MHDAMRLDSIGFIYINVNDSPKSVQPQARRCRSWCMQQPLMWSPAETRFHSYSGFSGRSHRAFLPLSFLGQVCVPLEWLSILMACEAVGAAVSLPLPPAAVMGVLTVLYYGILDPLAAATWAPIQVACCFHAHNRMPCTAFS